MIPDARMAEDDDNAHAHRYDMHPALVACDPLWRPDHRGNPFFAELASVYGRPAALTLWELAGEWHRCELASELRYWALGDVA